MNQHADVGSTSSASNETSDKQAVLHIYNVETLYNHVVNSYVEWQTTVVEAIITTNSATSPKAAFVQQERCVWKLACLLYIADSYQTGQGTQRCRCRICGFARALRNYLTHRWTSNEGDFALRGSSWNNSIIPANPGALNPDNRLRASGLSLFLYRGSVQQDLKKAIEQLGEEDDPIDVVPLINSYITCVATSHRHWREDNPIPKVGNKKPMDYGYDRNLLIDMANELRDRTALSLGRIQLYGNPQAKR